MSKGSEPPIKTWSELVEQYPPKLLEQWGMAGYRAWYKRHLGGVKTGSEYRRVDIQIKKMTKEQIERTILELKKEIY